MGSEFAFPAYVQNVEVVTAQDGTRAGMIRLGNDNANGVITMCGANELQCLMPAGEAARLATGRQVAVKGKVIGYSAYRRTNPFVGQVTVHLVVAKCDLRSSHP